MYGLYCSKKKVCAEKIGLSRLFFLLNAGELPGLEKEIEDFIIQIN
jgi:hypothetical protein